MNLFTETLKEYLIKEWERVMNSSEEDKKLIFIIESLDPENTFDLFSALEEQQLKSLKHSHLECHFRVAKNLWDEWCLHQSEEALKKAMIARGAISENEDLKWIDQEDRLTWYRSRIVPEDKDGMVIVLLGFNHASDQGGLADFHMVDENRVWNELGHNFIPWIRRINEELILDATEQEIEYFDSLLHQLFKVRPRLLTKLAEFFERKVSRQKHDFDSFKDVIDQFYKLLPFWDIPPLLNVEISKKLFGNFVFQI